MLQPHKHPLGAYIEREGINRRELARRLNVNPGTITRLFIRGRRPVPEVAARIRDLLGFATLDDVYAAFAAVTEPEANTEPDTIVDPPAGALA